jgi:D-Tyr-tRNAtyr deacylase
MNKGNKPSFHQSASGEEAKTLYQTFYRKVGALYEPDKVKDGVFAAMMDVALDHTSLDSQVQLEHYIPRVCAAAAYTC